MHRAQANQKQQHDKHVHDRQFKLNDSVSIVNFAKGPKWLPGVIVDQTGPVSFHIRLDDGRVVRRHQDHIHLRLSASESSSVDDYDLPLVTPVNVNEPAVSIPEPVPVGNAATSVTVPTSPVHTPAPEPVLRRSTRVSKPPDRLSYK